MANDTTTGKLENDFVPETGSSDHAPGTGASDQPLDPDGTATEKARGARQLVKEEASKYTGQAGDRIRSFADDGKARATGALDELARTIDSAAGTIDEKVGAQFGGYVRTASTAVSDFSQKLGDKDVDDLVADAREFVRKSPGVAIGAAAALGFVLARVLRSGVDANRGA